MIIKPIDLSQNQQKLTVLLEQDTQQKQQTIPAYQKKQLSLAAFDDDSHYLGGINGEIFGIICILVS